MDATARSVAQPRPAPRSHDPVGMTLANKFNRSAFGRWINSPMGRAFRLIAGTGFAMVGLRYRRTPGGKAALIWSVFPLSAGGMDVCWISAALGGPLRGELARAEGARLPGWMHALRLTARSS